MRRHFFEESSHSINFKAEIARITLFFPETKKSLVKFVIG